MSVMIRLTGHNPPIVSPSPCRDVFIWRTEGKTHACHVHVVSRVGQNHSVMNWLPKINLNRNEEE